MRRLLILAAVGCALWGADWLTDGGNVRRDAWQRDEKILSVESVKNMKLLWKLHLDNQPMVMHSLFPPLIIDKVNTPSGIKQIAIEAGSSDNIYAIDVEKGEVIWKKHFDSSYTPPPPPPPPPRRVDILCPGGLTATPVIAPTATPGKYTIYSASWDGKLHQLNAADGEDQPYPPITATKGIPHPIIPRRAVKSSRPRPKSIESPPTGCLTVLGGAAKTMLPASAGLSFLRM